MPSQTRHHRELKISRWLLALILCLPAFSQAGVSIHLSSGAHYGGYSGYGYRGYRQYGHGYNRYRNYGQYGHSLHRYRYYGHSPYYRYRYSYPRYNTTYPRAYSAPRTYSAPSDGPTTRSSSPVTAAIPTVEQGWDLLVRGNSQAALNVFSMQARSHPSAGIPKAGYALASAAGGDLNTGIWAMRRALRLDPAGLDYLPLNPGREQLLDKLIERYTYSRSSGQAHADNAFMIAALHYLRHNYPRAKTSVDQATGQGDQSTSTTNLVQLLRQRTK